MTSTELDDFRKTVNNRLASASREAGRPLVLKFPRRVLQEAGARPDVPPFAVIASRTMDRSVGRYLPCCSHATPASHACPSVVIHLPSGREGDSNAQGTF